MKIFDDKPILIDVPMPIETDRIMLRPPQAGDGAALYEAKQESMADLKSWMAWAHGEDSVDINEEVCREGAAKFILREDLMMLAFNKESGKLIGSTGLHRMNWQLRSFEIGYWMRTSQTGKGYATEFTNALIRYAFDALSAQRLYITCAETNLASKAIIEKLGFKFEGRFEKDEYINGKSSNTLHYARFNAKDLPALHVTWPKM